MTIELKAVPMFDRLCFTAWNLTSKSEVLKLSVSPNAILTKHVLDHVKAASLAEAFSKNIVRRVKFPNGRLARTHLVDFTRRLPKVTIFHIMAFLGWKDVIKFGMVSRFTRRLSRSNMIWEKVCRQHLDPLEFTMKLTSPREISWIDEFLFFVTGRKQKRKRTRAGRSSLILI